MYTYTYKNFETWVADGKKSGYENFSKEKKLVKEIIRFLKKAWDRVRKAWDRVNFFSKLYARIPKEIKKQFVSVIFTIILWRISSWLAPLIQGWFGNFFTKVFPTKTISVNPAPRKASIRTISTRRKIFYEIWSFLKPIAQALIIKRL